MKIQFYAIVNNHLAKYLLKCFRFDEEQNIIEQCVAHLASIFIHRSELRSMAFTGSGLSWSSSSSSIRS